VVRQPAPPTTPRPNRSTPPSNAKPYKAAPPSLTNAKPGWPHSGGCTATTRSAAIPGSDNDPRSPTRTSEPHRLRWPWPH